MQIKYIGSIKAFASLFLALSLFASKGQANVDYSHANILLYHHVSNSTPASTSISPDQFKAHLQLLKQNFHVVSLPDAIAALRDKQPLPTNSVVITFDDGYKSIVENAHPLLEEFTFPYTVFVNPDVIGSRADQMTWADVKTLNKKGVTFANHTNGHIHMLNKESGESKTQWLARLRDNILTSQRALEKILGPIPKFIAFPYGEYNDEVKDLVSRLGFVGFGQQSGGVAWFSDFAALPRFPAAGKYANLNTLGTKLKSVPFPVTYQSWQNPEVASVNSGAEFSMYVTDTDLPLSQTMCFFNGVAVHPKVNSNQLTVQVDTALPPGRHRVNCTMPVKGQNQVYYWYSQPFFVRHPKKGWLD